MVGNCNSKACHAAFSRRFITFFFNRINDYLPCIRLMSSFHLVFKPVYIISSIERGSQ